MYANEPYVASVTAATFKSEWIATRSLANNCTEVRSHATLSVTRMRATTKDNRRRNNYILIAKYC